MVNKRFLEMAKRQKTEGFLEAEAQKAEEVRRAIEEQKKKEKEEVEQKRRENLEKLVLDKEKKEEYNAYIGNLGNYQGSESDTAFYAFVNNPDFPTIYNQLETIASSRNKWGFILRRAYEIGADVEIFIGNIFQGNNLQIKKKLEDYGIYLLCPYFKDSIREKYPKDDCLIDGHSIMTLCEGDYEICTTFQDRAGKSAAGLIRLPKIKRQEPKIKIPKLNVKPVDLEDLEDWWQGEGEYE